MKIMVFGATGGTGKHVVAQALEKSYHVTGVVRDPDAFNIQHNNLEIIKGDVMQPGSFENAITGKDAIISCLGPRDRKPTTVYSEGITNIINAMEKGNVNRIICLSAGAVIVPPKTSFIYKFIIKNVLQRIFRNTYADMLIMEKILKETKLNWTIIRPPRLLNSKHTGKYRTSINGHLDNPSKISRADLADCILRHLTDEKTFRSTMEVSY